MKKTSYIDIATLNEYAYSCTTSVVVTKPTASWKETRDGFSLPSNNTESVTTYKLEYRKNVEHGNPIFACRFHTDIKTVVCVEPIGKAV